VAPHARILLWLEGCIFFRSPQQAVIPRKGEAIEAAELFTRLPDIAYVK